MNNSGYLDLDGGSLRTPLVRPTTPTSKHDAPDMLDNETYGLLRDDYVSKLVQLCENQEDALIHYRQTLLSRARSIDGCPKAKLVTRRTTGNKSAQFKYANDCYLLNQFIAGDNSMELKDVFSKAPCSLNIPATPTTPSNSIHVSRNIQDTVAELSVNMLKLRNDIKAEMDGISQKQSEMLKDIQDIRNSFVDNDNALNETFVEHINELGLNPTHAAKLKMFYGQVLSNTKQRSKVLERCDNIDRRSVENARNIENVLDKIVKMGCDKKTNTHDIQVKLNEAVNSIDNLNANKDTFAAQMTSTNAKLKSVSNKVTIMSQSIKDVVTDAIIIQSQEIANLFNDQLKDVKEEIHELNDKLKLNNEVDHSSMNTSPDSNRDHADTSITLHNIETELHTVRESVHDISMQFKDIVDGKRNDDAQEYSTNGQSHTSRGENANCDNPFFDHKGQHPIPIVVSNRTPPNTRPRKTSYMNTSRRTTPIFRRLYIGALDHDDTINAIYELLSQHVRFYGLRTIHSNSTRAISASVQVHVDDLHVVRDNNFWPGGLYCREWHIR